MNGRVARRIVLYAVPFVVLLALRHQLVLEMGGDYAVAWRIGLLRGVLQDAAISLLPIAIASLARASLAAPFVLVWGATAAALCAISLANLIYFRYFGSNIELWVVAYHLRDLWTIRELVGASVLSPVTVASVATAAALTFVAWWRLREKTEMVRADRLRSLRTAGLAIAGAALLTASARGLAPGFLIGGSAVSEHVVLSVYDQLFPPRPNKVERDGTNRAITAAHRRGLVDVMDEDAPGELQDADAVMSRYRRWKTNVGAASDSDPVTTSLTPNPDAHLAPPTTAELRRRFGFSEHGPINVIVLFLETVRAYEVLHPEMGRELMSELWKVIDDHGILFPTTYTSSLAVGLTVRAQFSTLCSMLPNFGGAATYIAHPALRVACLSGVAADAGYRTLWMSGTPKYFHNKFVFESLHGMQEFYDHEYFAKFPFKQLYSNACDYPDQPFLRRSFDLLEQAHEKGKPFFASMLTLSTHSPYAPLKDVTLPSSVQEFLAKNARPGDEEYEGYLQRLRYLDHGLGVFVEHLFASKFGDNTLVVILGDHGSRLRPPFWFGPAQYVEMSARVPMAFISKKLRQPERIEHAVHQVDIAPTIAAIAGLAAPASWLGRNLFGADGSPWMFMDRDALHYRVGDRACYTEPGKAQLRCYRTSRDPLFNAHLPKLKVDPGQTRYFTKLGETVHRAITLNALPGVP